MVKKMRCPICKKRIFDISKIPKEDIQIELKCLKCFNLVLVPCNEVSEMGVGLKNK